MTKTSKIAETETGTTLFVPLNKLKKAGRESGLIGGVGVMRIFLITSYPARILRPRCGPICRTLSKVSARMAMKPIMMGSCIGMSGDHR